MDYELSEEFQSNLGIHQESVLSSNHFAVVVVSSPHYSPRCGVTRFRLAQSITIQLSVWLALISPAHLSRK